MVKKHKLKKMSVRLLTRFLGPLPMHIRMCELAYSRNWHSATALGSE